MAGTNYTSRRQYLSQAELVEYASITITDATEADDQISQAEELIDAYVGYQERFLEYERQGKLTSASGATLYDVSTDTPLNLQDNYFSFCEVEIIGGTGIGQRGIIASSNQDAYSITLRTAFDTTPDNTSVYKIYQLGKFPRCHDYFLEPDTETYYKSIPEAVKRATAAQLEFMINQGTNYFASSSGDKQSESIGNYSYSLGDSTNAHASVKFIAPKAKALLKGLRNSTGQLVVDNPTTLGA